MTIQCKRCEHSVRIRENMDYLLYECKKLRIFVENGEMEKCPAFSRKPVTLPKEEVLEINEYLEEEYQKERIP